MRDLSHASNFKQGSCEKSPHFGKPIRQHMAPYESAARCLNQCLKQRATTPAKQSGRESRSQM